MRRFGHTLVPLGTLLTGVLVGCGVVGPPIPPEDVGVAPTIARQKKAHESQSQAGEQKQKTETPETVEEPRLGPPGQDEELPPLRPVGTR